MLHKTGEQQPIGSKLCVVLMCWIKCEIILKMQALYC